MTATQLKYLEYVKGRVPLRAALFERCYTGKAGLPSRIRAFCIYCMGINLRMAKACPTDTCPLWGGRPHSWTGGRTKKPTTDAMKQRGRNLYRKQQEKKTEQQVQLPLDPF